MTLALLLDVVKDAGSSNEKKKKRKRFVGQATTKQAIKKEEEYSCTVFDEIATCGDYQ
jgi:hypothetical protein